MSDSFLPYGLYPARLLCPWNSPGKNMGVGFQFLLQENPPDLGIKPTSLVSPALAGRFLPGKPYALLGTVRLLWSPPTFSLWEKSVLWPNKLEREESGWDSRTKLRLCRTLSEFGGILAHQQYSFLLMIESFSKETKCRLRPSLSWTEMWMKVFLEGKVGVYPHILPT